MPMVPASGDFLVLELLETFPWPCGKTSAKISSLYITLKALGHVGTFMTSLSHLTDSQMDLHWHPPECVLPFLHTCSHVPSKWNCWHCSWSPCSSNISPQVAAAKSTSYHLWKHPPLNGLCLNNMLSSSYFQSPQRAGSIFRQYQMSLMTEVPTWS